MINELLEVLIEGFTDTLKLVPFLFLTYLFLEFIENKASDKTISLIKKSGKLGPIYGSLLGLIPLCGFSSAAASFYTGGVISLGTLLAVFVATSDEMLPILISGGISLGIILEILLIKGISGIVTGYLADLIFKKKDNGDFKIEEMCEKAHCECEKGIFHSALIHTLKITGFILIMNIALGILMLVIGKDTIASWLSSQSSIVPVLILSFIGLIPNCGTSVIITTLYVEHTISLGALIAGLVTNAGVGLAVLAHLDSKHREVIKIVVILLISGIITGLLVK